MLVLFLLCLIASVMVLIMLWKTRDLITKDYEPEHKHFKNAASDGCIVDSRWSAVLDKWNEHSSFGSLSSWITCLFVFFILLVITGIAVGIWAIL